mmetsp:Transcript_22645/g.31947  ORF Transcript_22645/g.31947 Transcript_22645/m.31947 type:complete len:412 (+) Transcript_22645:67-1302(+)
MWCCQVCTFNNNEMLTYCEMCGSDPTKPGNIESIIAQQTERERSVTMVVGDGGTADEENKVDLAVQEADLRPPGGPPTLVRSASDERVKNVVIDIRRKVEGGQKEFFCAICQCNELMQNISPTQLSCSHKFCKDCFEGYVSFEVSEGRVLNMACPGRSADGIEQCSVVISPDQVRSMLDEETVQKYNRFRQMRADPSFRDCPFCGHGQKGYPRSPATVCENCKKTYCFFHSNAHPDETCSAYKKRNKKEFALDRQMVKKTSCTCPWCKAPIFKSEGCNHMTCSQCKTSFCYLCNGRYFDGMHFSEYNCILGCPGMQSAPGEANCRATCGRKTVRFFCWPIVVILLIAAAALYFSIALSFSLLWVALVIGCCPLWMFCCLTEGGRDTLNEFACLGPKVCCIICTQGVLDWDD